MRKGRSHRRRPYHKTAEFLAHEGVPGAAVAIVNPLIDLADGRCPVLRKQRYPTESAVQRALDYAQTAAYAGEAKPQGWHDCGYCGGYHLRSKEGTKTAEARELARRQAAKKRAKRKRYKANKKRRRAEMAPQRKLTPEVEVQSAIDSFPGHTFAGRLDCEGEANTDIWRVVIRDGKATRVEPRIVWPEDAEGE